MRGIATVETWVPRASSVLSMLGSSAILHIILCDRVKNLSLVHNRLVVMMSVFDIVQSIAFLFSTAPSPVETGVNGAIGNRATCTAQGFMIQLGVGAPMYNAALCVFFLCSIRYNISQAAFVKRFEPYIHTTIVTISFSTSLICAVLGQFNARGGLCWIDSYPFKCRFRDDVECTSGLNASLFELFFGGLIASACVIITTTTMALIYLSVSRRQKAMRRYSFNSCQRSNLNDVTKDTAMQATLFVGAMMLTFLWPSVAILFSVQGKEPPDIIIFFQCVFLPLQGLFNFIIYIRPDINLLLKENSDKTLLWSVKKIVFSSKSVRHTRNQNRRDSRINTKPKLTRNNIETVNNSVLPNTDQRVTFTNDRGEGEIEAIGLSTGEETHEDVLTDEFISQQGKTKFESLASVLSKLSFSSLDLSIENEECDINDNTTIPYISPDQ